MLELLARGGWWFMLPLVAASVTVVAIAIERWLSYRRCDIDYDDFRDGIARVLERRGPRAAQAAADQVPGPVARVWSEGLGAARHALAIVRDRMETTALAETSRLERNVPLLGVIAQVAPLVGLLGTVWGMILSFQGVEGGLVAGAGVQGEQLAGGIWKALVTTAAGLAVAIPALLSRHYLEQRIDRFVELLERSGPDLTALLVERRSPAAGGAGGRAAGGETGNEEHDEQPVTGRAGVEA